MTMTTTGMATTILVSAVLTASIVAASVVFALADQFNASSRGLCHWCNALRRCGAYRCRGRALQAPDHTCDAEGRRRQFPCDAVHDEFSQLNQHRQLPASGLPHMNT
jgi:hypothetical protein